MSLKCFRPLIVAAAVLFTATGSAQAALILEAEPNNSLGSAQNIDAHFTLDFSADIGDVTGANTSTVIPHVTISGTGDGTFDYYSFFVPVAGAVGIFDIDYGMNDIDTELGLFDAVGNVLAADDDFSPFTVGAGGSIHFYDAFIQHTFGAAGTYIIGVGRFNSAPVFGGMTGATPDVGDDYTLQVSIDQHPLVSSVVPEPASLVIWGVSALGLAVAARRRRKQAA